MPLTLPQAAALIREGTPFGTVAPLVDDLDALRAWYTREPGVPVNTVKAKPAKPDPVAARERGYTGDVCGNCGGSRMVRNGACLLCQDCATSSGCS